VHPACTGILNAVLPVAALRSKVIAEVAVFDPLFLTRLELSERDVDGTPLKAVAVIPALPLAVTEPPVLMLMQFDVP